jgi:hypothetical protein
MSKKLLSFDAEQARRGAYASVDRGLLTVEVARITGSVGRAAELGPDFRYRGFLSRTTGRNDSRVNRLRALFDAGRVPPLELYQIGDDYFVVDGHHRVAIARQRQVIDLDAHVVEFRPDRADPKNAIYYERSAFIAATGLREIHATEAGRYPRLLSRIQSYRHEWLVENAGQSAGSEPYLLPMALLSSTQQTDLRRAAQAWYAGEYRPVVDVLLAERVPDQFPGRGMGDLYGYVSDHRWYLSERRGWDVGLDAALVDFARLHRVERLGAEIIDPVIALGADAIERVAVGRLEPLRRLAASAAVTLTTGLAVLPIAFLRGLRPRHYRFPASPDSAYQADRGLA